MEPVDTTVQATGEGKAIAGSRRITSFAGDVLKLASGATVAQALSVLLSPILTRLYGPEAYGLSAIFTSITGIIGVIVCLCYELSIMLPQADEEATNLVGICLVVAVSISLLMVPLVWLSKDLLLHWLKTPQLGPYLWMVPLAVFLSGVFLVLNYWNTRRKCFGRLAAVQVLSASLVVGIQLAAGYSGHATGGSLLSAGVIGLAVSTLGLGWQVWRDDAALFRRSLKWQEMWLGVKRYSKFPLYSTWSILLNSISWQLPTFFFSHFFSSAIVGYYALSNRLLRVPLNLIASAISQVFFQRAAQARAEGKLAEVVEPAFRGLTKFGMFPMCVLTIVGSDLCVFFFGPRWFEAGIYAQILAIWTFTWFISSPMSTLFAVLERQEWSMRLNTAIFITRLLSLGLGGILGSARLALFFFAGSGVLVYSYMFALVVNASGMPWRRILAILVSDSKFILPACLLILLLKFTSNSVILVFSSVALLGTYYIYVFIHDAQLRSLLDRLGLVQLRHFIELRLRV
jgi:lipopolysaccharide exporter